MNEITQLKKLMEAVVYNEAQYDDEPFMQAHNLPDDSIYDAYQSGNISYDEAEAKLKQMYRNNPDELDVAMATLNTYYGDQEVEWDEESGGGIVREEEGQVFNDCSSMLRSLLSEIAEFHLQLEADYPHDDLTLELEDIVRKYLDARVR